MRGLLTLLAFVAIATLAQSDLESDFADFKSKFNKTYKTPEEEAYRKGIFLRNLEAINEHNEKYKKGEVTWQMGVNPFADLSQGEFAASHLAGPVRFSEGDFRNDWENFKVKFERHYKDEIEEAFRKGIFRMSWENIIEHNKRFAKGEVTYEVRIDNFTDWSKEEFKKNDV